MVHWNKTMDLYRCTVTYSLWLSLKLTALKCVVGCLVDWPQCTHPIPNTEPAWISCVDFETQVITLSSNMPKDKVIIPVGMIIITTIIHIITLKKSQKTCAIRIGQNNPTHFYKRFDLCWLDNNRSKLIFSLCYWNKANLRDLKAATGL